MAVVFPAQPLGWRYLFYDLLSNEFVGELPLINVSLDIQLSGIGVGSFRGSLVTGDPRVRQTNWHQCLQPARTVIYTEVDGAPFSAHILWDLQYHTSNQAWDLNGTELWSYFSRLYVAQDYAFLNVDQVDIARHILADAMARSGAVSLTIDPPIGSGLTGVLRNRTLKKVDAAQIDNVIRDLAQLNNGFDYAVRVDYSGGGVLRRFITGYPKLGRAITASKLRFTFPGSIQTMDWPRQGSMAADVGVATGSDGTNTIRADVTDTTLLAAGWPLLEIQKTYSGTETLATLTQHAAGLAAARRDPLNNPGITVLRKDLPVALTDIQLGDEVLLTLEDPAAWPAAWDAVDGSDHRENRVFRLWSISVTPATDQVQLLLSTGQELDDDSFIDQHGDPVIPFTPTGGIEPPNLGGGDGGGPGEPGAPGKNGLQIVARDVHYGDHDGPNVGRKLNVASALFTVPGGCNPGLCAVAFGSISGSGNVAILRLQVGTTLDPEDTWTWQYTYNHVTTSGDEGTDFDPLNDDHFFHETIRSIDTPYPDFPVWRTPGVGGSAPYLTPGDYTLLINVNATLDSGSTDPVSWYVPEVGATWGEGTIVNLVTDTSDTGTVFSNPDPTETASAATSFELSIPFTVVSSGVSAPDEILVLKETSGQNYTFYEVTLTVTRTAPGVSYGEAGHAKITVGLQDPRVPFCFDVPIASITPGEWTAHLDVEDGGEGGDGWTMHDWELQLWGT